ncbi:LytR family transcriptional regulator [Galbitalea soli]|uniref:LytR family transcriptional regulator n=2 Tax=Galbitalea soli TaxID=1268042 RepID=A0A7C9PN70_9MICO|nr:LCP family protein [Galbitalea soli]NEM91327.1 LytR family transcriptional regulator [Galbitalea soli]
MAKRAWWLVVLNLLIPGSAQVLAGNRRLGRFGLGATLVAWALTVILLATWMLARTLVYSVVTSSPVLLIGEAVLVFYAVLWIVLTLDTLRLARLIATPPSARRFVAGFAVVMLLVTAGTSGYGAYLAGVARGALDGIFSSGQGYAAPIDGRYNVLLLGGDAGPDRTGLRPDSISVVSIDATTGKSTVIGVPRNMQRVPFVKGSPLYKPYPNGYDCGVNCLISFLYTYGEEHPSLYPAAAAHGSSPGIEAMRDAVEGTLGITLQYYVLIDMKGFSDLIDALGGVTIDVTERLPINGGQAPDGTPINVQGWIEPGVQKMNGYTALWYARSRHSTSDYDRMARQRQVQAAILAQFSPATVLTKFQAVANAGKQVVKTDIPQLMLGRFVDLADKARTHKLTQLELVPPTIDEIHPDFAEIRSLVKSALKGATPTSTPTP